jgi:uncharacterized C2H2 Zn-finger protein
MFFLVFLCLSMVLPMFFYVSLWFSICLSMVFKCFVGACNFIGLKASHLAAHIQAHSGRRVFECYVCNALFQHKKSMIFHMNVHQGVRPHKCFYQGCDYSATSSSILSAHLLVHNVGKNRFCFENLFPL